MKRTIKKDPFFEAQPPLSFVEDLKKPLHLKKPKNYGTRERTEQEIDARGLFIAEFFPDDPDGLLETIYDDFKRFTACFEIAGNRFPVVLKKGETECFEAYKIVIANTNKKKKKKKKEGLCLCLDLRR